jgi:hypothetical protein
VLAKGWIEMIRKVYEVDPLICPSCGGPMNVVSFIEEPKTIDRIIRHLELTFEAERPPPPHHVQQELLMAAEQSGEYFKGLCRCFSYLFEGRVHLEPMDFDAFGDLCCFLIL